MKTRLIALLLALLTALPMVGTGGMAMADDDKRGLFGNLTTDDTWAAAKAIRTVTVCRTSYRGY